MDIHSGQQRLRNRTLFVGRDNWEVMKLIDDESIDLIATDPPFNTGVEWSALKGSITEKCKFEDRWDWNTHIDHYWLRQLSKINKEMYDVVMFAKSHHSTQMGAFCGYMGMRIMQMKRILKPSGNIFVQCDTSANTYWRLILDACFGKRCFRNEIAWCYDSNGRGKSSFAAKHDTIYWYSKHPSGYFFNQIRVPVSGRVSYNLTDHDGRAYLIRTKNGKEYRSYADEGRGCYDWWSDIKCLNGMAKERTGYPTQKPIALYQRIVKAGCPPSGKVMDPFAGSGTTLLAADSTYTGEQAIEWIGIELNHYNTEYTDEVENRLRMMGDGNINITTSLPMRYEPTLSNDNVMAMSTQPRENMDNKKMSKEELRRIHEIRSGSECNCCGMPGSVVRLHVDRIIPGKHGGWYTVKNTQLLCPGCNGAKRDHLIDIDAMRKLAENCGLMWSQISGGLFPVEQHEIDDRRSEFAGSISGARGV